MQIPKVLSALSGPLTGLLPVTAGDLTHLILLTIFPALTTPPPPSLLSSPDWWHSAVSGVCRLPLLSICVRPAGSISVLTSHSEPLSHQPSCISMWLQGHKLCVLGPNLPALRALDLSFCNNLYSSALPYAISKFPALTHLNLSLCRSLREDVALELSGSEQLQARPCDVNHNAVICLQDCNCRQRAGVRASLPVPFAVASAPAHLCDSVMVLQNLSWSNEAAPVTDNIFFSLVDVCGDMHKQELAAVHFGHGLS